MAREVVHCWEIAGGTRLSSLLEVCLTPEHIDSTAVIISVDLSDPGRMMEVVLAWVEAVRTRVDNCLKALAKTNPARREAICKAVAAVLPANHPDRSTVRPLGIPALLCGTKYDLFQDLEAEQRKVISRTLRFIAHLNGMSLLFVVAKDEGKHLTRFRAHVNHLLFGTALPDGAVTAYTKPLVVPRGQDTFDAIGRPAGDGGSGSGSGSGVAPVIAWKEMFDRVFPPKDPEEEADRATADEADKFRETVVDAVVSEKEQEFARAQRLHAEVSSMIGSH